MKYTLIQAEEATKRSKSSLWRDIKKGKITCEKDNNGTYLIEASELFRVYPESFHETPKKNEVKSDETNYEMRIMELQLLLQMEKERISEKERHKEELKQQVEDIKKDRDQWRQQAQQVTYLLEDKRGKKEADVNVSWLKRIFRREE